MPLRMDSRSNSPTAAEAYGAGGGSLAVKERHGAEDQSSHSQLKDEISMLNRRLDMIDQHCHQFTKLAREKAVMEENLKNLALISQNMQNKM